MSAQSSPAARETSPPFATPQHDPGADFSFDARWAAWIERGRQHDLAVTRKLRVGLLGAAVIGLLLALFFRLASGAR
jgi:hypothetical protein